MATLNKTYTILYSPNDHLTVNHDNQPIYWSHTKTSLTSRTSIRITYDAERMKLAAAVRLKYLGGGCRVLLRKDPDTTPWTEWINVSVDKFLKPKQYGFMWQGTKLTWRW